MSFHSCLGREISNIYMYTVYMHFFLCVYMYMYVFVCTNKYICKYCNIIYICLSLYRCNIFSAIFITIGRNGARLSWLLLPVVVCFLL